MNKGTSKKLSATVRGALLAAGYTVRGGKLVDIDRSYGQPDDLVGQAVLEDARLHSKLGWCKTERAVSEAIAAGLEDLKIAIGEMQEALAPGVTF